MMSGSIRRATVHANMSVDVSTASTTFVSFFIAGIVQ